MRIRVGDPQAARDLVRFLRRRGYLAVADAEGVVEAVPIESAGEAPDRARTLRDLAEWSAATPARRPEPLDP